MARVILISDDERSREKVGRALDGARYELLTLEGISRDMGLGEVEKILIDQKPAVVVMDYWPEDAASVKLMQSMSEEPLETAFIFIDHAEETTRDEVLLALNEGAEAFLPYDFNPGALFNYIERAFRGPGRLRWKEKSEALNEADSSLEEAIGDLRIKNSNFEKLIARLLSAPVTPAMRKTLVVSDSSFQRDLLKKILEEHNLPTLIAPGFDEGLALALEEKPRTIVSDLDLGGQTGVELCRAIKLEHKLIPCHFVICTASQDKAAQVMIPGNGVDDCLVKPSGSGDTADFISRIAMGLLL